MLRTAADSSSSDIMIDQVQLSCRALEGTDVNHRRESGIQLDNHILTLEADRVGHRVTIIIDADQGAVDQADLDSLTAPSSAANCFLAFSSARSPLA